MRTSFTGGVSIPPSTVWGVVANRLFPGLIEVTWSPGRESIVWDVRFPRVILGALGAVARAKGMTELAKQAGMSRESLYRALSKDGNPQLSTVMKVLDAMGYRLDVKSTAAE